MLTTKETDHQHLIDLLADRQTDGVSEWGWQLPGPIMGQLPPTPITMPKAVKRAKKKLHKI